LGGALPIYPVVIYSSLSISLGPAEGIHKLHLLDRLTGHFKQPWTGNHDRKPLGPRHRDVQAIPANTAN
jgi:hypothetical protein